MDPTVVIIGAGQAGLAASRCLSEASVDHVVLERGDVANSWRTERWDSLRLLTPNWLSRLPGHHYGGTDPDGYMTAAEMSSYLDAYRTVVDAPVRTGVTVTDLAPVDGGFRVATDQGTWRCRAVIVATGAASDPKVPALAAAMPSSVEQLTPNRYRNPDQVAAGRVLVVGASASGVQIADELARSGRDVTIAIGDHVRVPRRYRGMDIHWWFDALGVLDERIEDVADPARAHRLPSLQVVGSTTQRVVDVNALEAVGVHLAGRLAGVAGTTAQFSGSLANMVTSADLKQNRLLDRIDEYAAHHGLDGEIDGPTRPRPTRVDHVPTGLDLRDVDTIVWATGHRPRYPWIDASLLDGTGAIRHDAGVGSTPGLYVLGLPFMRRRKSNFIDGVGPDARELVDHLVGRLAHTC